MRRLRGVACAELLVGLWTIVGGRRGVPPLTDHRERRLVGASGAALRLGADAVCCSEAGIARRAFENMRCTIVSVVGRASHCVSSCTPLNEAASCVAIRDGSAEPSIARSLGSLYLWQPSSEAAPPSPATVWFGMALMKAATLTHRSSSSSPSKENMEHARDRAAAQ